MFTAMGISGREAAAGACAVVMVGTLLSACTSTESQPSASDVTTEAAASTATAEAASETDAAAFVEAVRAADESAAAGGYATLLGDVADEDLVAQGVAACEATDQMTDEEFLAEFGAAYVESQVAGDFMILSTAQEYLCEVDHLPAVGLLWSDGPVFSEFAEADWQAMHAMAGSDAIEDVYLWYLSPYGSSLSDEQIVAVGEWACAFWADGGLDEDGGFASALAGAAEEVGGASTVVYLPVRLSTVLCPEWDEDVTAAAGA